MAGIHILTGVCRTLEVDDLRFSENFVMYDTAFDIMTEEKVSRCYVK
jgi:hypothetical protein